MSLGPFDLTGGPFLQLYGALLLVTIVAGFLIPRWLRPEGRTPRKTDTDQLAYLAGGGARLAEAVAARLLASRQLVIDGKKFVAGRLGGGTPAERSVLALPQPIEWEAVVRAVGWHAEPIRAQLIDGGLLMDGSTGLQLRFWQASPYLLLLAFGWTKLEIGQARDRPIDYLTVLLVITAILALLRFLILDRKTRAGQEVLAETRARSERLSRAPTSGEADLAVALFGTAVLVGSEWGELHRMRANSGSGGDSGSSSSSSSDGGSDGSGCGGGGCGGCGS
jgi:uncharacterized protein (TIGR04222 family)